MHDILILNTLSININKLTNKIDAYMVKNSSHNNYEILWLGSIQRSCKDMIVAQYGASKANVRPNTIFAFKCTQVITSVFCMIPKNLWKLSVMLCNVIWRIENIPKEFVLKTLNNINVIFWSTHPDLNTKISYCHQPLFLTDNGNYLQIIPFDMLYIKFISVE